MHKLIPTVGVPIYLKDITNSIWLSIFSKRKKLLEVFNKSISNNIAFKYVRTFQSGYLSLYHLLLKIKGNNLSGEIIIPVYTCPSVYFAVKNSDLIPIFIDAELSTINASLENIETKISKNTLAIIVQHIFGCYSVDIKNIRVLLRKLGREDIIIIEDMCQALGDISNLRSSDKQYGDYGILSFGRAKMISTVNGGALVSNNIEILDIKPNKNQNGFNKNLIIIIKSVIFSIIIKPYFFKIAHLILNKKRLADPYNLNDYKKIDHSNDDELTNYQLSLGINMLNRLDDFNSIRKTNAEFYIKYFNDESKYIIQPSVSNFYIRFSVLFKNPTDREYVKKILLNNGIITSIKDYPLLSTIHDFQASNFSSEFSNASLIESGIMTFPTHPGVRMKNYTYVFDELMQKMEEN